MFYVVVTIMSILTGTLLPLELSLVLLCPLLFVMHVAYMGILFGVFHAMHIYLGFNYHGTATLTAGFTHGPACKTVVNRNADTGIFVTTLLLKGFAPTVGKFLR